MKSFRDYFYFPKCDRTAILALGCIAVFAIGVLMICDALKSGDADSAATQDVHQATFKAAEEPVSSHKDSEPALHAFDPNMVDSMTLISFGLAPYKVRNFIHYRRAGKRFHSADDMRKTYGWTDEDVERLRPYVTVSERNNGESSSKPNEGKAAPDSRLIASESDKRHADKFASLTKVDVNLADSATLRRIPGVGEKICNAIIAYRRRLGGLHSTEQLLDISIVSPELLEWFVVDEHVAVKRINVNTASFQVLNSHPYISYEQTRDVLKYRRLYGKIENETSLLNTGIFSREDIERLRAYLEY